MVAPFSRKVFAESGLAPRWNNIVVDQTGLEGEVDFRVQFADDRPAKPGADLAEASSDPPRPSLASALQQQLGLKMETQKVLSEVGVVDRRKASVN